MIIQNTNLANQPALPDIRVGAAAPSVAAGATPHAAPKQQPSAEQLKNAVDVINKALQQSNHSLEFSLDNQTKTAVVKIIDTSTGQLICQIPSQATLAISQEIDQIQQGLLLKHKA